MLPAPSPRGGRAQVRSPLVRYVFLRLSDHPLLVAAILVLLAVHPATAQPDTARRSAARDTARARPLGDITVTATRSPKEGFRTPSPVIVVDSARIRRSLANRGAEILRAQPGPDLTGTRPTQGLPG